MYTITARTGGESTVMHEAGSSEVKVDSAQITREVNKFDSLTFTVYPDNPAWDGLVEFATTVTVADHMTGKAAFDGRVIQVEPDMDSDGAVCRNVTCESVMGYLCDSLQDWREEMHYGDVEGKTGLKSYLEILLDVHNAKVEEHKRIYLGDVMLQTFETSGGVTKGIARDSTWKNIEDKLLGVFGGEMRVRRTDGTLYLDYAESLGTTRATRIEIARNMESASRSVDPNSVITRFYPFGAKLTEEVEDGGEMVEQQTEKRVTIESVNGGKAYIDDTVAMAHYGIIEGYNTWDDVTQPQNLLTKAQAWLGDNNALPVSHTITALDLSLIGLDYDRFEIFDSYPCYNPLIGLDETLEIVKQTVDISEPENSSIELGETSMRLSSDIGGAATKGDVQLVESQTKTEIVNVENRLVSKMASITVDTDQIVSTVTEQVEQTVTTKVEEETKDTVSNVSTEYYVSTSPSAMQGGSWSANQPVWQAGRYIWIRTKTVLKDGTTSYGQAACITGPRGAAGTSVTVQSTKAEYQVSTSGTNIPTGAWLSAPPAVSEGKYLWTRGTTTYSDGSTLVMYSVSKNGEVGSPGTDGRGISSYTPQYYLSTSKTAQTGGTWTETPPLWEAGKYLWTRARIVYTNPTETLYTQPAVDSSWEAVNRVQVGARNLVLQSGVSTSNEAYMVAQYDLSEPMVAGETYTVTVWGELGAGKAFWLYGLDSSVRQAELSANGDGSYGATFTAKTATGLAGIKVHAGPSSVTGVTSTIDRMKLEKGNKGTDWTPAPEDVDSSISESAGQLQDSIDGVAEDLEGTASDLAGLQQTTDEIFEITQTNSQQITQLIQDNESFNFNFQQLETVVTTINGQVTTEYNERLKYIKFIDGEIWLGRDPEPNEDDFKLIISNNRISFKQNNVEVAYVSNDLLYITNARIITRLEIGDFAFFPRENGNMSLRYIG